MNIQEIATTIRETQLSPGELADLRLKLSAEYAFNATELENILMHKAEKWQELRKEVKSDTQAERLWQATDIGQEETGYKLRLKSIEKLMSGIKTMLDIKEHELRGHF